MARRSQGLNVACLLHLRECEKRRRRSWGALGTKVSEHHSVLDLYVFLLCKTGRKVNTRDAQTALTIEAKREIEMEVAG